MQEGTQKGCFFVTQPDFIVIPTQVLTDDSLQTLDKILFGYIYWMTKQALMKCVAGNITLAELTNASQRGVANSLNRLEKQGYISRIYRDESHRVRSEVVCNLAFNASRRTTGDTLHEMMKPLHETMKPQHLNVTSNDEQNKKIYLNRKGTVDKNDKQQTHNADGAGAGYQHARDVASEIRRMRHSK